MGVKNLLKTVWPFSEKISILDLSSAEINTIQYKVQFYIDKGNVRLEVQYDVRYSINEGNVRSGHDDPINYQND